MTSQGVGVLGEVLDELIERHGRAPHEHELLAAKEEFAARAGRVFEDEELFEARTSAFLEWYVIERTHSALGRSPIALGLAEEKGNGRHAALRAWATSHRSLFEVTALGAGEVTLADLLGGGHFVVKERRRLFGVDSSDIVEARLLAWRGEVRFGRTFLYHASGTKEAILGHARRIRDGGGTRLDVVDYAASLRLRAERYRHVPAERVYEVATSELTQVARGDDLL